MNVKKFSLLFISLMAIMVITSSFSKKDEWNLYKQSHGVQIYYKLTDCDDAANGLFQKYIIFKLVNTTDFAVKVEWEKELWYNNICTTCDKSIESKKVNVSILAHKEIIGDYKNSQLSIFAEFKNHPDVDKLTKFEFMNLNIKPILR